MRQHKQTNFQRIEINNSLIEEKNIIILVNNVVKLTKQFKGKISENLFIPIVVELVNFYNECARYKDNSTELNMHHSCNDEQVWSSLSLVYLSKLQNLGVPHITFANNYFNNDLSKSDGLTLVKSDELSGVINDLSIDISVKPFFIDFVKKINFILKDYEIYFSTILDYGYVENRIMFVNFQTRHLLTFVIIPNVIVNKIVYKNTCDIGVIPNSLDQIH